VYVLRYLVPAEAIPKRGGTGFNVLSPPAAMPLFDIWPRQLATMCLRSCGVEEDCGESGSRGVGANLSSAPDSKNGHCGKVCKAIVAVLGPP